jgi:hypothetical protein
MQLVRKRPPDQPIQELRSLVPRIPVLEMLQRRQALPVEGRVMELAQGETVRHDGFALRMAVRKDVGGVEQLHVTESTDGAMLAIRSQDAVPELNLTHAMTYVGSGRQPNSRPVVAQLAPGRVRQPRVDPS